MNHRRPAFPRLTSQLTLGVTLLAALSGFAHGDLKPDLKTFQNQIHPLLKTYCVQCHGSETSEAKIRFDNIDPNILTGQHFGHWEDAREAFNTGQMPPEDAPQPTDAERKLITGWLDVEFKKAQQYGNPIKRGRVRRLTRYELRYALEDLLQISASQEITALPDEGTSSETGLKNSSRLLMISSPHLEAYLNVILSVIDKMKTIAAFEPHQHSLDIANLDLAPPTTFAAKGRKNKPPVNKVKRAGKGVDISPGGHIDLKLNAISQYKFQTSITAKSKTPANVQVSLGFQYSDVDPRQKVHSLGTIETQKTDDLKTYTLKSDLETIPAEMKRALDRPFFIRITNRSKQKLSLTAFDYQGNVNTDLTSTLIPADIAPSAVDDHVRQSVAAFLEKAFRRSPTDAELAKYEAIYQGHASQQDPTPALLDTYKEILCSPSFFYLGLPGDLSEQHKQNYKLAERLAFALWCSVPDDRLLQAASKAELTTPAVLATHVERMLADEKSNRWVEIFTDQWLQTSKLLNVAVDRKYYPRFKDGFKELMRLETIESVNDVFRNGSSALNLLQADHVFVNQTLAAFYGIKGVRGQEFTKVRVDKSSHRGGLLTQGAFLVGNSDGMNSHAILRGVWLAEVILNDPPPDPPNNVPPLDESIPGFDKMTLNQKLFAHRNNAACKSCHQQIDPWGIPFENFDASGSWREQVLVVSEAKVAAKKKKRRKVVFENNYLPIQRDSTLPDGVQVDGVQQLKDYLLNHRKRDFARALTERLLAYALSRDIDFYDEQLVDHLVDTFEHSNYSVPMLIREIAQSEQFRGGN